MKQNTYILVGGNFINKGAEAMLKTVKHKILERHPNAKIYAICHQEEREIATKQGFFPLTDTTPKALKKGINLTKRIINKVGTILGKESEPYADYSPMSEIEKVTNLTAAIDVSGFAYGDKRGYIQPLETQKIIDFCKRNNAPYIFMPQAWGSFKDKKVAENSYKMIKSASAFFTRDHVSRKYVADLLHVKEEEVPLLPDIAFHFPIPTIDGADILKKNGIIRDKKKMLVGISPNMRVYERMEGKGADNEYVKNFCSIIKTLSQQFQILLIPNEIRPLEIDSNDDQFLCKTIYNALENKDNCNYIDGYYSAEEIKALIKQTDIIIASRFHSLVFALSLSIPCMAISWSHKYRELFKLFGLEEFVLEDKGLDTGKILETFNKLVSQKEAISDKINATLPKLKDANKHVFDLLN